MKKKTDNVKYEITIEDFNKIEKEIYKIDRKIDNAIEIQQYFNVSEQLNGAYDSLLKIEEILTGIKIKGLVGINPKWLKKD